MQDADTMLKQSVSDRLTICAVVPWHSKHIESWGGQSAREWILVGPTCIKNVALRVITLRIPFCDW